MNLTLHGKSVIRVYLKRQVVAGIDKFHKKRELIAIFFIDTLPYKILLVFPH